MMPADLDCLQRRIIVNSTLCPESGCWIWHGKLNRAGGYPRLNLRENGKHRSLAAHRVAYVVFRGGFAAALHIDHTCQQRLCVNPMHLEPVTPEENYYRRWHRP